MGFSWNRHSIGTFSSFVPWFMAVETESFCIMVVQLFLTHLWFSMFLRLASIVGFPLHGWTLRDTKQFSSDFIAGFSCRFW